MCVRSLFVLFAYTQRDASSYQETHSNIHRTSHRMLAKYNSFCKQILRTVKKATKGVASLSGPMSNIAAHIPASIACECFLTTVSSCMCPPVCVLLYRSEVWAHVLGKKYYGNNFLRVQQSSVLEVTSSYYTFSERTVSV